MLRTCLQSICVPGKAVLGLREGHQSQWCHLTDPDVVYELVEREGSWRADIGGVRQSALAVGIPSPGQHAVVHIVPAQQRLSDLQPHGCLTCCKAFEMAHDRPAIKPRPHLCRLLFSERCYSLCAYVCHGAEMAWRPWLRAVVQPLQRTNEANSDVDNQG